MPQLLTLPQFHVKTLSYLSFLVNGRQGMLFTPLSESSCLAECAEL
jgi:hypothetical protein